MKLAQIIHGAQQILNVGGEIGIGKVTLGAAEPGEVEPQDRKPLRSQRPRDSGRCSEPSPG